MTNLFEFNDRSSHTAVQALFGAVTLQPDDNSFREPLVPRSRLIDIIDRPPLSGPLVIIVGPYGSGKTVLALQWIQQHGNAVQYIGARSTPALARSWEREPNELGDSLAELLNACSRYITEPDSNQIAELLERVIEEADRSAQSIVLDNLELLSLKAVGLLISMLEPAIKRLRTRRIFLITKIIDTNTLAGIQSVAPGLRLLLPETLEFNTTEATLGHELGVFGNSSHAQVIKANEESGGWITGMKIGLDESSSKASEFRDNVLHELLLEVINPILHAMIAASYVPWYTLRLWEEWFDYLNLPHWSINSVQAQLPTRRHNGGQDRIEIVPVMRDALIYLSKATARWNIVEDLLTIAMNWFVSHNEMQVATDIANKHNLELQFLKAIKSICKRLSNDEDWPSIVEMVESIPDEILIQDSDITFWTLQGYIELDQPQAMYRLWSLIQPKWEQSDNPLIQGRLHLGKSFRYFMINDAQTSLRESMLAYETLPSDAHQERLWTTGMAAIAAGYLADSPTSHQWAAKALVHFPFLPTSMRWWHNCAGPIRISQIATSGKMMEAYEFASQQVASLRSDHPNDVSHYLLIQAGIDTERLRFDAAETWIQQAKEVKTANYWQTHYLHIAEAALARARGDLDTAWEILGAETSHLNPRHDLGNRATTLAACIAFEMGDVSVAKFMLGASVELHDTWPKHFGDHHPDLLRAVMLSADNKYAEAVALTMSVIQEGRRRGHIYFVVAGYSVLSYVHSTTGEERLASDTARSAIRIGEPIGFQLVFKVMDQDIRNYYLTDDSADIFSVETPVQLTHPRANLTSREREVLNLVAASFSNKQIAEELYISLSTVKNHLVSIYDKLGTNNRRSAVSIARELKLLDD